MGGIYILDVWGIAAVVVGISVVEEGVVEGWWVDLLILLVSWEWNIAAILFGSGAMYASISLLLATWLSVSVFNIFIRSDTLTFSISDTLILDETTGVVASDTLVWDETTGVAANILIRSDTLTFSISDTLIWDETTGVATGAVAVAGINDLFTTVVVEAVVVGVEGVFTYAIPLLLVLDVVTWFVLEITFFADDFLFEIILLLLLLLDNNTLDDEPVVVPLLKIAILSAIFTVSDISAISLLVAIFPDEGMISAELAE